MLYVENRRKGRTIVAFSGLAPKNHVFEWTRSFKGFLGWNFIGVVDPVHDWYQTKGPEIIQLLQETLDEIDTTEVCCIGGSAGGFAALWLGKILEANKIVAFSPQSACGQAKRDLGDYRWEEFCLKAPSMDLKGMRFANAVTLFSNDDKLDKLHAERIISKEIYEFKFKGHNLAGTLKNEGQLENLLLDIIGE